MSKRCITTNSTIEELAAKLQGETIESVKGLVELWQDKNNKDWDTYPTASELNNFRAELRKGKDEMIEALDKALSPAFEAPEGKKVDTKFSTSGNNSYPSRTRENANWSDITIALAQDFNTAGEKLTKNAAKNKYVSSILSTESNNASEIAENLYNQIKAKGKVDNLKINIAGNGIYSMSQNQAYYNDLVTQILEELQNKGVTIAEIRSGGQTGIDEAGIIAAQRLGIPSEVHSTANFMFRDKSGKDISDEQAFKSRFSFSTPSRQEERLGDAFDTPIISTVEEQAKVDLDFDPRTRRDRVSLIARFFSNEIDTALQEHNDTLNKRIADAEKEGDVLAVNELKEELATLDRFKIIKLYTPAGLFSRVRDYFNNYILDSEENRIQSELNIINSMKGSERYSDEQKYEAAKKKALYKTNAYQKVVDNFKPLAEEASTILIATEGIRIDPNYIAPKDANLNNDTPEGDSAVDTQADDFVKDEAFKDGWITNYREVSSHESLSQEVRKVIREIPQLDYRGKYDKDDLGNLRFLDADYVHATLIDKLRDMITSDDMLPLLETLGNTKPWTKQIVKKLQAEPKLFSQFYQDFRKDFMPYWIQKKKLQADGTFKMETIAINKPEGVYYLLDEWRDNYENGNLLDDDSIYDKNGDLNLENAENGLKWTEALNNRFTNLSTEQRLELLQDEKVWKTLNKLLNMIGINANQGVLLDALTNIKQYEGGTATDPIMLLLPQLNIIFSGVKKGEVKSETLEDGTEKRGDLINTFGSAYSSIAMMLAEVTEDAIESSVRENDKSYYSHVTPNYLGKLIKQLKNVMGNEARFKEFVENEFGQYEWFYKDGRWRNDWIEQLVNNPEMRRGLSHKVLLNSDKVAYQNWDDLDYTLVLLTEYFGDPDNSKSDIQWANYHVPILSDSPSAEFIRFRKYDNHSIIGEDGEYMKYDDIILDRMVDLVNQEVDRIALVNQRDVEYQKGNPNIAPIANYDIIRDEEGKVKSKGGSEFKFLTALNDVRYDNGETFLDRFQRIQNEGTGAELREFIRESVREALDNEFEQTYREWAKAGLLEELPNGKYKYLGVIGVNAGQSSYNRNTATSLNNAKKALEGMWTTEMDILLRDYNNNNPVDDRRATTLFESIKDLLREKMVRGEITAKEMDSINRNLVIRNNAKAKLREYFWNSKFATSQIIELTTTDLAFYKNIEDFQKRYKEVHAPALRLNTNSKYGRKEERTIYLKDDEIVSSALDDIATVLDERVKKGEMSKRDRDLILNKFREVNVADAQAYRSLSSYRAILDMSGQWTDDMQRAFDNFQNGKWDMADFNIIWQTKKPYVYTQVNNMSGVQGHTGIKTPVQHKNSEFLLMAMHQLVSGPLGKSGKLVAINEFMEENGIDVVQFESTTKVGKQGVIDLNNVNTKEDVKSVLKNATTQNGVENPNVVHKVSYEDYGIQTATPEHAIDAVQLVGTQIRKLITADISPDVKIDVNGREMSKQEWLDMYNAINTENIIQAFADVNEIFKDPKQVEKILLEELRGNQRYGIDMIRACTLNEKGQFNIPLFDPVQSQRVQTLLNSIIKSRITKQKIRGGALIQVSDYGLTDELKIVFEGEGENKRIKYLEVYMPAYSRKFYEPLMKAGSHELDINKLPDSLRKLIGYRVPTEDKYSMAPLYIKGFLPQQNGSAIMLPAEITTLSGSDFDVDKLYIMLPEFKITPKYNRRQFVDDLVAQLTQGKAVSPEMLKEYRQSVNRAIDDGRKAPKDSQEYNLWKTYKANREKYRVSSEDKIEKIEYDFSKSPQENSLEARNNLLIDMMWGVLTNADTASKELNPGGFDYQKKSARIINILQSSRESELRKELNIPENQSTLSKLQSMDLKKLDKLAEKFKKKLDPLNPRTQVQLHQQNMTGAALIGIYANHNANHALMQHTELGLDTENGSFLLNGKRLTSLHGLMNDNKEYISRNNAGFLAASVDNVKDPVLASLNQNTFTADASMLLSRLGYNPIEIGLIMSQPIVMDITNTYFRESREGKGKDTIIDEVIENYKKRAAMMEDVTYDNYKSNKFMADELADNIILQKEVKELGDRTQTSDYRKVEFYKKQVAAGYLFKRIMGTADALGQLVQATRADTQGGAAGPTIADTQIKIQKVDDFLTNVVLNENSPLTGADVIMPFSMKGMDIDQIRERLLSSPLPYLQAFFSLGIDQTQEMFSRYFPQFTSSFREVIDGKEGLRGLRQYTKTGKLNAKTLNNIYNDLLAYIMSKTSFFGQEANLRADDKVTTSSDKRRDFINNFPDYFNRTLSEHPEIAELEFVKRLRVIRANQNNPVDTVVFKNVGQLSPTLRERYMRDWQSLLYMGPEAQALALNLFRYSYYRNGFAFGPSTFIHLAPTAIRQSVPEYIDTLRGLLESEDDYSQFIDQYIYNHLDNRQLVPEVPTEASTSFTDEQGDALDMVKITIDTESNSGDKKIIRKREGIGEETTYDFFNYIARRYKGGTIYYRLTQADNVQPNVAVYERIDPLGFKNSFIEYEYGKDVTEMKSVIEKNDRNYTPNINQDITAYQEADIDYDSMPEYLNYDFSSLTQDIASEAFSQVYGAPLEVNEGKADDINSISPNTEYEDANNDKICGANTLYEL
jgi:hypothetical protein